MTDQTNVTVNTADNNPVEDSGTNPTPVGNPTVVVNNPPADDDPVVELHEEAEQSASRPWWQNVALVVLGIAIGALIGILLVQFFYGLFKNDISDGGKAIVTDGSEISWKDTVTYSAGGSGPSDPAGQLEGDITAVDHTNRLIVSNQDLDVRGCFPQLDDDSWKAIVAWADQWGDDSPTRIEWQVNESRCSWVIPGDITDPITEADYEEILTLLADAGYTETWFVSGPEGGEFGRVTYTEIMSASSYISRVHVYGDFLASMPVTK